MTPPTPRGDDEDILNLLPMLPGVNNNPHYKNQNKIIILSGINDILETWSAKKNILKHLREFVQSDWFLPVLYHTIETRRAARLECLHHARTWPD